MRILEENWWHPWDCDLAGAQGAESTSG